MFTWHVSTSPFYLQEHDICISITLHTHIGKPNKPSINTFFPPSYKPQQKLFEVWYNVKSQEFSNWNIKRREVKWQVKTYGKQEIGRMPQDGTEYSV